MRSLKLSLVTGALLMAAGCDLSGDWLFSGGSDVVPGVIDLGELTPVDITSQADIAAGTVYGEVAATGNSLSGGVTFTFEGTGGDICLWVDPEVVFWNQSVSPTRPVPTYEYPNNVYDDGDIDIAAGFAAYYNGSPGELMGDFAVRYTDSLGNPIEVALNECTIQSLTALTGGHSGRGAPEYCTLNSTQPGVNYLVAMTAWSTPLDDERMGYGVIVANGTCNQLLSVAGVTDSRREECLIVGEAIDISDPNAPGPWFGLSEVPSREGSVDFEAAFCATAGPASYCEDEALLYDCTDSDAGCYCGDPADTPSGGSL